MGRTWASQTYNSTSAFSNLSQFFPRRLIINIIYSSKAEITKRREKLRFLTRESMHMKTLLSKYAEAVLADLVKRMKHRDLQKHSEAVEEDDEYSD